MSASPEVSLKCGHASFKLYHLHVKGSLFTAEGCYLLLEARVLLLLMRKVTLDIFFNFEKLVGQSLAHILCLQSEILFQYCFFLAQTLHILFVIVEFILNDFDHFLLIEIMTS